EECSYFTVEDRFYYVVHPKGRYQISKTLNDLETELDPAHFFRANRGAILNRRTVQSYAYWERGKYIVRLNKTCQQVEIALPRARLQEFRDWLGAESIPGFGPEGSQSPILTDSF
ncbi:MAG: LytTR family transcriptional regulator, partial [Bacteroidetes bacterium]|nr:LytTR family transcriptional regulator [Fibrella sp.]